MPSITSAEEFDGFFRKIVKHTCEQWGYDLHKEDYYTNVYKRLFWVSG
jgi:lipid II:glycine glycyltransferase (peptidoglycan interpeptide bridge formation enzyme)